MLNPRDRHIANDTNQFGRAGLVLCRRKNVAWQKVHFEKKSASEGVRAHRKKRTRATRVVLRMMGSNSVIRVGPSEIVRFSPRLCLEYDRCGAEATIFSGDEEGQYLGVVYFFGLRFNYNINMKSTTGVDYKKLRP